MMIEAWSADWFSRTHMINKHSLPMHTTPMKMQTNFSIIEISSV